MKPPCTCPHNWQAEVHHPECATRYALDDEMDTDKMEAACDRFILLAEEMDLSRKEMSSVTLALAASHLIATGVPEARAGVGMIAMYRYRRGQGVDPKLLVREG